MMRGRRTGTVVGAMMLAMWLGIGSATQVQACEGAQVANAAGAAFLNAAKQGSASAFSQALSSYADMDQITIFALGRYQNQLHPSSPRRADQPYLALCVDDAGRFRQEVYRHRHRSHQCRPGEVISRFSRGARGAERVTWRLNGSKITDVHVRTCARATAA
jgi:hypothetical protein